MLTMILQMSGVTAIYILVTMLIWAKTRDRKLMGQQIAAIGIIYGICCVLSTHFGVNYVHMMLNVRDIGPLAAGMFFHPVAGIIAGLIGGIERYVAGTYFNVGSYTRIACSVSTCLAGFLAAFLHEVIFRRKKPSVIYAFFMGAVMEVFHMYVVLITHRDDMEMAFYVVQICAFPMIIFTGLGLGISSLLLKIGAKEWKGFLKRADKEDVPISHKFQLWLFAVTAVILAFTFVFSYLIQTQRSVQDGYDIIQGVTDDIQDTYNKIKITRGSMSQMMEENARQQARVIASMVDNAGGVSHIDNESLEKMRSIYNLVSVLVVNEKGKRELMVGRAPLYDELLEKVLRGDNYSLVIKPSDALIASAARCKDGMVQLLASASTMANAVNMAGLDAALSNFHVGNTGTFDIINTNGYVTNGTHQGTVLESSVLKETSNYLSGNYYQANLFGDPAICRKERLDEDCTVLVTLPLAELYASRDTQAYETMFADILLFAVIYVLTSLLVQQIVVRNLELVNESLNRITHGNLNEEVSVRNSTEFTSLSNDINQTVTVLKGYIHQAEKRIEEELILAKTIQASVLPKNFEFPRNDFELFASMDPAKEVGGDFYDFFFTDSNKLALVIADVSGKGIPAALFMMRGKTAIRSMAETGATPAEVLRKANSALCEGNDAEMFITAWLGILDLQTGRMECANAGHEYPVLMRNGGDFELLKDKHGMPLAVMEGISFKEYELQLQPGDRLFVYTDGIPEAIDEKVEQYGSERLVAALNSMKNEKMMDLLPGVRQNIREFVGNADQFDDITMLGITYFGKETER